MNPLDYVKVTIGTLLLCGSIYGYVEHSRFETYKLEVKIAAEKQEAETKSIVKQQNITTEGIKNEYEARLTAVRNYYFRLHNTRASDLSPVPNTSITTDAITPYNRLAESCSETTIQLISLQEWIRKQENINAR